MWPSPLGCCCVATTYRSARGCGKKLMPRVAGVWGQCWAEILAVMLAWLKAWTLSGARRSEMEAGQSEQESEAGLIGEQVVVP